MTKKITVYLIEHLITKNIPLLHEPGRFGVTAILPKREETQDFWWDSSFIKKPHVIEKTHKIVWAHQASFKFIGCLTRLVVQAKLLSNNICQTFILWGGLCC